jgi:hypothetical protein
MPIIPALRRPSQGNCIVRPCLKKPKMRLVTVAEACNPRYLRGGDLENVSSRPVQAESLWNLIPSNDRYGGTCLSSPVMWGTQMGVLWFQLAQDIKGDPTSTNTKRARGMAQVVNTRLASMRPRVQPQHQKKKRQLRHPFVVKSVREVCAQHWGAFQWTCERHYKAKQYGEELRTSHLQGRCSTTPEAHTQPQSVNFEKLKMQKIVWGRDDGEIFFFFWCDWGLNSGLHMLPKQALYHLSHASSPFCSGCLGAGSLKKYLPMLASNHNPPNHSLPRNQDYRNELPVPGLVWVISVHVCLLKIPFKVKWW